MGDRDAALEGGPGPRKRARCVALDEDPIGLRRIDHAVDPCNQAGEERVQALTGLHGPEIEIRNDREIVEHLIKQRPVLAGDADDRFNK